MQQIFQPFPENKGITFTELRQPVEIRTCQNIFGLLNRNLCIFGVPLKKQHPTSTSKEHLVKHLKVLLFSLVTTLECYECSSYKSMEDCTQSKTKTWCPPRMTRCHNMTVQVHVSLIEGNLTGFQRGCAEERDCENQICPRHFGELLGEERYETCQINCCKGDLCPEGNVTEAEEVLGPEKGARGGSPSVYARRVSFAAGFFFSSIGCYFFF